MSDGDMQQADALLVSRPVPALRLNQREPEDALPEEHGAGELSAEAVPFASIAGADAVDVPGTALTRWIRLLRVITGLLLLLIAWGGLLLITLLLHMITQSSFALLPFSALPLLPVVDALLALWIGVVVVLAIFFGAFLVYLALTVRGW